jgi:hypothetical protein
MKKIISILLFVGIMGGCASSPTHQEEMQKNIDKLELKVSSLEEEIKLNKEERKREVNLLCGLVGEASSNGQIIYLGDDTFQMADGSFQEMDQMEKMCNEIIQEYQLVIESRISGLILSSE